MPRNQLIQIRRDTTANWTNTNPIPAEGELCLDTNTGYLKVGDGSSNYVDLPIFTHGASITEAIGIEWDTSSTSPTLKRIDINGNERSTVDATYFDNHSIWGNIKRCTINPAIGLPVYGTNARGDGLDLTGASGNVMVKIPKFYVKFSTDGTYHRWWISPVALAGFELHPAFLQRGGTEAELFVSAYEAAGFLDGATFKLTSATGLQPVTGDVSYPNLPNSGRLYIMDAGTYANNIGTGYGIMNIWTWSAIRLLVLTELGTLNSQAALGRGIVDLALGTGYAGLLTGALSADTNVATNGSGMGTGTNGATPVVWRGIENIWGNTLSFVIGVTFFDTVHWVLKPDGTGVVAAPLTTGNYVESASVPPNTTSGYISRVFVDSALKYMMLGSAVAGSSSTYACDLYTVRETSATGTHGQCSGAWGAGDGAGINYQRSAIYGHLSRQVGARIEFLKR
ncbi:hypothetical protein Metho_1216 [Methanomethylovorans hollandica DSM 15978]|uniref:Major tropism determinant N-terminal domain-containing protein n=1 Tax=Methanomethylovorans hollandica (strain DSM 15978 / NBRC 107637 / DMS1) TaxID=867904 RepID=L0KWD4_METHD|nr:hypothetical protein [Methanomethylovorans hollandica]AGB49446.1 hypothetical protein Metho_1216 [Methanomethylovorans hollandica DSM 15978]